MVPAGLIVMLVPAVDFTSLILARTLLRATNILTIKAMLIANINIIAPDRTGLRRVFFTPRVKAFIEWFLLIIGYSQEYTN